VRQIRRFLQDIDQRWTRSEAGKQPLCLIGSCALMLQTDYERGTKDGDVLHTVDLTEDVRSRLLALAGPQTDLHRRHAMYLEVVAQGLPLLAQTPLWHPLPELNAVLSSFEIRVLDVLDVVVSKLARFHPDDRADILAMVKRGLVSHRSLLARFEAAIDVWKDGAHADKLPACVRNLNRLERDYLGIEESEIELPSWVRIAALSISAGPVALLCSARALAPRGHRGMRAAAVAPPSERGYGRGEPRASRQSVGGRGAGSPRRRRSATGAFCRKAIRGRCLSGQLSATCCTPRVRLTAGCIKHAAPNAPAGSRDLHGTKPAGSRSFGPASHNGGRVSAGSCADARRSTRLVPSPHPEPP
jgi:hypothetical protein